MKSKTGGLILLNKPPGITSFKGLSSLKKNLETGKVGHTGTLDKFADGLIVSLFGKMTKLVPEFTGMDKEYEALVLFGSETDTLDPEGEVIHTSSIPDLSRINDAIGEFIGSIKQAPPQYSAIHINGKRAYQIARSGKEVQIPERDVIIHSLEIISFNSPQLKLKIKCSKGTYIRSLARDLAIQCNSRAHLINLKRISVGPFQLENAVSPQDFDPQYHVIQPWAIFDHLSGVGKIIIKDEFLKDIKMGKTQVLNDLKPLFKSDGEFALFDKDFEMIALIINKDEQIKYRFVC